MWAIHCSQPVAKHASKAYKIKDEEKRSIWAISLPLSASLCLTRGLDTGFGVPEYVECTRTGARSACNQNGEQAFRGPGGGRSGALMLLLLLPPSCRRSCCNARGLH